LRDGSWCAYALDRAGRSSAAAALHHWVATTLLRHAHRVEQALAAVRRGRVNPAAVMLPARFTLSGQEEPPAGEVWPNFQTDCYGLWLWALADHVQRDGHLDPTLEQAARLVVRYLLGAGEVLCFDCWEEHPGNLHTASLVAVSAGLRDAGALLGDGAAHTSAESIQTRLLGPEHILAGGFIRFPGDTWVDGSLLWLGVPFGVVAVDDDRYTTTLSRIREELYCPGGGVRRYQVTPSTAVANGSCWPRRWDGPPWPWVPPSLPPSCWPGSKPAPTMPATCPNRSPTRSSHPTCLPGGRRAGGAVATPLLWSHAMHVILCDELQADS